jgi:hypothetical protein
VVTDPLPRSAGANQAPLKQALFLVPKRRQLSLKCTELSPETNGITVNKIEVSLAPSLLSSLPLCDLQLPLEHNGSTRTPSLRALLPEL